MQQEIKMPDMSLAFIWIYLKGDSSNAVDYTTAMMSSIANRALGKP